VTVKALRSLARYAIIPPLADEGRFRERLSEQFLLTMYIVRVKDTFCAAHLLAFHDGTVEPLHGHNWAIELAVACATLDAVGMGVDFSVVYALLHELLDSALDHRNLNHVDGLGTPNPTSENLAQWLAARLGPRIAALRPGVFLQAVSVWETEQYGVTLELPLTSTAETHA